MRDNHDKPFKHDDPPNSRLFVAHTRQASEAELREAFEKYGKLEDVYLCRDKNTGEQKDIAFIKFSKTSDAARAVEDLNGKTLQGHSRPLKVTVAISRDHPNTGGGRGGDDMERLLRLFVTVPKSMTEDEVAKEFQQFGNLDYVSVVRDRETKESKGYAFVKFTKPSYAATAFEESDRSFKAVFARPKEQDQQRKANNSNYGGDTFDRSNYHAGPMQNSSYSTQQSSQAPMSSYNYSYGGMGATNRNPDGGGNAFLSADVPSELSDVQLRRLFDLLPGFVSHNCVKEGYLYDLPPRMEVRVEYNTQSAANYALEKLNGFEYPPGKKIYLASCDRTESMLSVKRDSMGLSAAPELTQELASITKALAEATNMIKLQYGGSMGGGMMSSGDNCESVKCTVRLPPPQPLARRDSKKAERLFIMGTPGLPANNILWDAFGRFGDLIEVYIISGKNCGFVNYAKKESADKAMMTLNGEELYNMKLKITYADPPKHDGRKRFKIDPDES